MTDRDLLELIATQVGKLTNQVGTLTNQTNKLTNQVDTLSNQTNKLTNQVGTLTKDMDEVKNRLRSVENTVTRIENTHGEKLSALFDARVMQNDINQQIVSALDRIDTKIDVLQMETARMRRVK